MVQETLTFLNKLETIEANNEDWRSNHDHLHNKPVPNLPAGNERGHYGRYKHISQEYRASWEPTF
jgi:hypothetical protein